LIYLIIVYHGKDPKNHKVDFLENVDMSNVKKGKSPLALKSRFSTKVITRQS